MVTQVRRACGGRAALQVAGRRDQQPGIHPQVARAERGVGQLAHPDRDVDALRDRVRIPVLEAQVELHLRMQGHELERRRDHDAPPERHRTADAFAQPAVVGGRPGRPGRDPAALRPRPPVAGDRPVLAPDQGLRRQDRQHAGIPVDGHRRRRPGHAGRCRPRDAAGPGQTVQMWARVGFAPPVGPAPRRGLQGHLAAP